MLAEVVISWSTMAETRLGEDRNKQDESFVIKGRRMMSMKFEKVN